MPVMIFWNAFVIAYIPYLENGDLFALAADGAVLDKVQCTFKSDCTVTELPATACKHDLQSTMYF